MLCKGPAVASPFFNSPKFLSKKIPLISNPAFYNSLRPIIEWNSVRSSTSRRMASRIVTARASAEKLKDPDQLIDSVKTFIFDCDGMILLKLFPFC